MSHVALSLVAAANTTPAADSSQTLAMLALVHARLQRRVRRLRSNIRGILADAGIGLAEVVTDLLGVSARAILSALASGETDAERLVALTRGRLKASSASLVKALQGELHERHRTAIDLTLHEVAAVERQLRRIEERMAVQLCRLCRASAEPDARPSPKPANHNARGFPDGAQHTPGS